MTEPTVADAINRVYGSLQAENADIDLRIVTLKTALARACMSASSRGLTERKSTRTRMVG